MIYKAKKLRLHVSINYMAETINPTPLRGEKRGTTSVTKGMLAKQNAQINAKNVFGQPLVWQDVYIMMYCSRSLCHNKNGHCWQDPEGKKHYALKHTI